MGSNSRAVLTSCFPAEHVSGDVTEVPAMECCACGTAKYRLTFYGNWSEKVHPKDYPSEFQQQMCSCSCTAGRVVVFVRFF